MSTRSSGSYRSGAVEAVKRESESSNPAKLVIAAKGLPSGDDLEARFVMRGSEVQSLPPAPQPMLSPTLAFGAARAPYWQLRCFLLGWLSPDFSRHTTQTGLLS